MLLVDLWSIAFWISKITKRKGLDFTQHREKLKELVWPNRVNGLVNNCNLRKGGTIKSGAVSFWKKSKRLLTPPPSFWKIILQIFYDRYGSIYARRYDGQIVWNACTWLLQSVSCFDFPQCNCWKNIPSTLKLLFCINFMLKKPV